MFFWTVDFLGLCRHLVNAFFCEMPGMERQLCPYSSFAVAIMSFKASTWPSSQAAVSCLARLERIHDCRWTSTSQRDVVCADKTCRHSRNFWRTVMLWSYDLMALYKYAYYYYYYYNLTGSLTIHNTFSIAYCHHHQQHHKSQHYERRHQTHSRKLPLHTGRLYWFKNVVSIYLFFIYYKIVLKVQIKK